MKGDPEVNDALKGFDIRIDEFGEITSNFEVDRINKFLNENIADKKLLEKKVKDAKHTETSEEEEKEQG